MKYAIIRNSIYLLENLTPNTENKDYVNAKTYSVYESGEKDFLMGNWDVRKDSIFDTFEQAKNELTNLNSTYIKQLNEEVKDLKNLVVFCIKHAGSISNCEIEKTIAIEKAKKFGIGDIEKLIHN